VSFEPGKIEGIGYDDGKAVAHHEIKTAGAPARVKLTAITGPKGLRADGSDVALINAEVVDAEGNRCTTVRLGNIDGSNYGPMRWMWCSPW
jgi:beta-galactosidase